MFRRRRVRHVSFGRESGITKSEFDVAHAVLKVPPRAQGLFDFDASDFDAAAFRALESIEVAVIALSFYSEQPQFNLALRTR